MLTAKNEINRRECVLWSGMFVNNGPAANVAENFD